MSQIRRDLHLGDCAKVLAMLPANSIDAIVTDPPYGLKFMGRKWDYGVPSVITWAHCLRVLKPGGHLLAFAGTRTQHRMACNIEDAGFDIRDLIAWVYGSGFPKSHNLTGQNEGWGSALKPALEPITLARKPFDGTLAACVQTNGTGAINVDGCRVESMPRTTHATGNMIGNRDGGTAWKIGDQGASYHGATGRWPANLIHDGSDDVLAQFPESTSGGGNKSRRQSAGNIYGTFAAPAETLHETNSGSAARFFYCAKATRTDRDEGLEDLPAVETMRYGERGQGPLPKQTPSQPTLQRNHHPTVKPTALMRYLCRLITPTGGVVLDPFMGSGSTGKAAALEGFGFVGIEREPDYFEIAQRRIAFADRD